MFVLLRTSFNRDSGFLIMRQSIINARLSNVSEIHILDTMDGTIEDYSYDEFLKIAEVVPIHGYNRRTLTYTYETVKKLLGQQFQIHSNNIYWQGRQILDVNYRDGRAWIKKYGTEHKIIGKIGYNCQIDDIYIVYSQQVLGILIISVAVNIITDGLAVREMFVFQLAFRGDEYLGVYSFDPQKGIYDYTIDNELGIKDRVLVAKLRLAHVHGERGVFL